MTADEILKQTDEDLLVKMNGAEPGSVAFERSRVTLEALQRREIIDALEKLITVLEK
jgi:hypothetical protein